MTEAIFTLGDGRKISYAVYGPPSGEPVLYFHGTPSSRREILLLQAYGINVHDLLVQYGIRIIAPDRGSQSTHHPQRTFLSFAADTEQLLRHLGVKQCPVLCWSGGGPYALAMAYRFPNIVSGVYILCGITKPFDKTVLQQMGLNKWYFLTARYAPLLLQAALGFVRRRKTKHLPPQQFSGLPYVDYKLLQQQLKDVAGLTLKEATRRGAKTMVQEAASYFGHYGFDVKDIQQPIHYWWGSLDMNVVELHAKEVETNATTAIMHYREGEGHLSLYIKAFAEALQAIARADASHTSFDR
ncbi:MAG TPA: alpha/beta hydrolase [Flavisolibacter sp.]|jgi:pimeloyl-ACP methyl ester carboxylesterase|nr:alpha/beta hydrolase [Flavisolibacter sp.]